MVYRVVGFVKQIAVREEKKIEQARKAFSGSYSSNTFGPERSR